MPFAVRGECHEAKRAFDKALADYNEAIRLDPRNPQHYSARAALYHEMGEKDKSNADAERARMLSLKR
jgi:tetratricopeptide (TPR) repeat protein